VAAAAVLVAGTTVVGVSTAAAADSTVSVRVGSYNIRAGVSTGTFGSAVSAAQPLVDVAGLQEVNSRAKEAVLAQLPGWGYYRPYRAPGVATAGEQSPVIWRSDRFTYLSGRTSLIAPRWYIAHELPGRPSYTLPMFATVVHLQDNLSGRNLSVVNVHLLPGAVINGNPIPGRPRCFAQFRRSTANLAALAESEKAFGTVYVLGDFNIGWVADHRVHRTQLPYATFLRHGMSSMWATQRPSGGRGSHVGSPSLIDQVYSTQRSATSVVQYGITYSDHYPVVARYDYALPAA
jgi:endonuclease/exonuclease/phosphatase family metal-dependent hydrolase